MSDIEITVRGSFTAHLPAERATVHLVVGHQGPDAAKVAQGTMASAEAVRSSILPLHSPDRGPVTWWASQDLRTWSHRPTNKDGKQLPLVHAASVSFEVKFSDFDALGRWLAETSVRPGVSLNRIEWALTSARRTSVAREVRIGAVNDAVTKAQDYAAAFGLSSVRAVAVADAGMLGEGLHPTTGNDAPFTRAKAADGGGEFQFAPNDIAVRADVDARFVAG